jgi:hypothetical protein
MIRNTVRRLLGAGTPLQLHPFGSATASQNGQLDHGLRDQVREWQGMRVRHNPSGIFRDQRVFVYIRNDALQQQAVTS